MLAFYLIGYGTVRFFIEFFREPDAHLGLVFFRFSTGQLLCALMVLAGAGIYLYLRWKSDHEKRAETGRIPRRSSRRSPHGSG